MKRNYLGTPSTAGVGSDIDAAWWEVHSLESGPLQGPGGSRLNWSQSKADMHKQCDKYQSGAGKFKFCRVSAVLRHTIV